MRSQILSETLHSSSLKRLHVDVVSLYNSFTIGWSCYQSFCFSCWFILQRGKYGEGVEEVNKGVWKSKKAQVYLLWQTWTCRRFVMLIMDSPLVTHLIMHVWLYLLLYLLLSFLSPQKLHCYNSNQGVLLTRLTLTDCRWIIPEMLPLLFMEEHSLPTWPTLLNHPLGSKI